MNVDRYRTLEGVSTGTVREKASKFIAMAFPIPDQDAFESTLHAFEKEHPTARHFCYGRALGVAGEDHRANDAGEPHGTAGQPILRRIQAMELTFCGVIVVRYFGGTLLGKAGLVHAYGDAAQLALDAGVILDNVVMESASVIVGYDRFEPIKAEVISCGGTIVDTAFTDQCLIRFSVPKGMLARLEEQWAHWGIAPVPE